MYIKKTSTIVFLIFLAQLAWAQNEKDEIILNSGKSIKGKIIAQKPGEYIKIVRFNLTDTIIVKMDDINELKKIEQNVEPNIELIDPRIDLYNIQNDSIPSKLMTKHHLRFYALGAIGNHETGGILGLGVGLSFHRNATEIFQYGGSAGVYFNSSLSLLPFSFDAKIRLEEVKHNKVNYFLKPSIGYSLVLVENSFYYGRSKTLNNITDGGLLLKLGAGIDKTNKRSKIYGLEFGILLQQFSHRIFNNSLPEVVSGKGSFYLQTSFSF